MSGESSLHTQLVERLVEVVRKTHRPPGGLLLLADHHDFGVNRPPTIGRFQPDLFASDLPATFEVIGEAKTIPDLETERSARQLRAFLDHLCLRPCSTFYLSVPPFQGLRAKAFMASLRTPAHAPVPIRILDGL